MTNKRCKYYFQKDFSLPIFDELQFAYDER